MIHQSDGFRGRAELPQESFGAAAV